MRCHFGVGRHGVPLPLPYELKQRANLGFEILNLCVALIEVAVTS